MFMMLKNNFYVHHTDIEVFIEKVKHKTKFCTSLFMIYAHIGLNNCFETVVDIIQLDNKCDHI
jgi:hypothetical protein